MEEYSSIIEGHVKAIRSHSYQLLIKQLPITIGWYRILTEEILVCDLTAWKLGNLYLYLYHSLSFVQARMVVLRKQRMLELS